MRIISTFLTVCAFAAAQSPQAPNPVQQSTENAARMAAGAMPIYRITVVERTTKAVNYNHRGGATKIDFRGTPLLPKAHGEAKVESKQGYIEIEVEFRDLQPATAYGPEYLTYVMWAITPEGRTTNLGEVLLNGTNSKLDVTTELQSFGLIVTAEPYFAVTRPSDVVVMENVVRQDTRGAVEGVDAKYELLQRGQYTLNVNPAEIKPVRLSPRIPLELYEARNAVQIARWTGAERYAPDTFQKAVQGLENGEGYLTRKAGRKPIATVAREAVQMAEDARIITVKRIDEERLANERQAGAEREALAESQRAEAQANTARVTRDADAARLAAQSEAGRVQRENAAKMEAAQNEADRAKRDNQTRMAAAQNEADRLKNENDARMAAAQNEADRLKNENDVRMAAAQNEADRLKNQNDARMAAAQTEADRRQRDSVAQMAAAQNEADRLKRENDAQRAGAQAELDRAAREKAQAEAEKADLRSQLLTQFNAILQTRDTARGLIVNMSDVLFDTAKFSLRPLAREKLAKVAGIVSGHPGLRLDVEGYTDSVGGDEYNQRLSEQRGASVRDYLIQQGMPVGSVTARGFGKAQPVASNDTAQGRQQNRRVELVIAGEIIGTPIAAK
ncbi:MAG: OmpA family protein [Bryobacteraceae bacterium]|jgi:outer membrane protein OmpA-like peptidoglycan-associated protein